MFKNSIESGLILPAIVISAAALNLNSLLYSSNLSLFEVVVSFIYLIIWVMSFSSAWKKKNYSLIRASTIFWIITFITSSIGLYIHFNSYDVKFFIPLFFLYIFFLTPLYGFEYIIIQTLNHRYMTFVLFIIISFIFSVLGLKFLIAQRKNRI